MQEFEIVIKTFTGYADGAEIRLDEALLERTLAAHGAAVRASEWTASDRMVLTVTCPSGEAAQQIAAALERDGYIYTLAVDGTRGRWIYFTTVCGGAAVGPGAPIFDLLTAGGDDDA